MESFAKLAACFGVLSVILEWYFIVGANQFFFSLSAMTSSTGFAITILLVGHLPCFCFV